MNSATSASPAAILPRYEYGALDLRQALSPDQRILVSAFVDSAVKAGQLPRPFITGGEKGYEYLKLDIHDALLLGGKVKGLVVLERRYWMNVCGGHSGSSANYFLVTGSSKKISVLNIDNWTCAKRAMNTIALGQLVEHYLGQTTVACKKAHAVVSTT